MSDSARIVAAEVLARVLDDGAFSQRALGVGLERSDLDSRDRGWVTRAVYGTLADLRAVDIALDRLAERGVAEMRPQLRSHLRIAIWEIGRSGRTADPAPLVNAAVNAVRRDGMPKQSGFANGVLRSLLRDIDKVFNPPKKADDVARFGIEHGLPDWIARRLFDKLGVEDATAAARRFNAGEPVGFRVRVGTREDALAELAAEGLSVVPHAFAPDCGVCTRGYLAGTAGHIGGRVAIQDAGAQLAVAALPSKLAGPILDATAGIGGKTLALVDRYGVESVVATDAHGSKLDHLKASHGLSDVRAAAWNLDEAPPDRVVDAGPYAAVVLDAPCSALGTMGRHPEVRWNREQNVVRTLALQQQRMIDAVLPLIASGGWLLYVVCTWTSEETDAVVAEALARHPGLELAPPDPESADPRVAWSDLVSEGTISLWPHRVDTDGFFIARFRKA